MKNLIVLIFAAFLSQAAFAQETTTTTTAPAPEKKACCASAEKSGKSCCAKTADAKGAACAHGTADAKAATTTDANAAAATTIDNEKTVFVKKVAASGKQETAEFKVWGNCGMCKKTIEKAAKGVAGVESATWNVDTHQFNVSFDQAKTNVKQIHQAIADSGYDTDMLRANDTAYNNLHGCCQYDRKAQ